MSNEQLAVGSEQLAVGSEQLAVGNEQLAMSSRQLAVGSGQWAMSNEQWAMGSWQCISQQNSEQRTNKQPHTPPQSRHCEHAKHTAVWIAGVAIP
jgi:X-X-X-Leu-X-X-Gly heptad repeat protein